MKVFIIGLIEYSLDSGDKTVVMPAQIVTDLQEILYSDITQTASFHAKGKKEYGDEVVRETYTRAKRMIDFLQQAGLLPTEDIRTLKEEAETLVSDL